MISQCLVTLLGAAETKTGKVLSLNFACANIAPNLILQLCLFHGTQKLQVRQKVSSLLVPSVC